MPQSTNTPHQDAMNALVHGNHGEPHTILGPHADGDDYTIFRTFQPYATDVKIRVEGKSRATSMTRIHDAGLYEARIKVSSSVPYQYKITHENGDTYEQHDPYAYPPLLSEYDLYLFSEGKHLHVYEKMGAHLREVDGVKGVNFAVWAPNAQRVSVTGLFNQWDERMHPMIRHENSGIWELFVPGLEEWTIYKFHIKSHHMGYTAEKTDPYGFHFEMRPKTGAVVVDLSTYEWQDADWMEQRAATDTIEQPMSTYEVHLGSWKRSVDNEWLTYRELADELVQYVVDMGYTHIEMMPVAEHPFDGSWGYQVTGYFAATSRYGSPQDFMYLVDKCHQNNIGVILDWVPAHFPKDGWALSYFDGTHLYSHEDPRQGEHPDWGTYIFNYSRNEVRNFLISNAVYWLKEFHIDGLRVDAVSSMIYLDFSREEGEWIPNQYGSNENLAAIEFLKEANAIIHAEAPGAVTIAEESTAWPMVSRPTYLGGLGFTFKWNMGWMHDTLFYVQKDPVYRRYDHNKLTFSLMYAFSENFVLSLSHDEVVHGKGSLMGKMPGDWWQKFASLRLLFGYQYTHPGKKLNFMGAEIAQWAEWSETRSLDWHLLDFETHRELQTWVRDLNKLYKSEPALYEQDVEPEGFEWIEANDAENSAFSYIRYAHDREDFVVVVCNFTPMIRENYRIGVPESGFYEELLNSDAEFYGGTNVGNEGGRHAEPWRWHNYENSMSLTLPPLSIVLLKKKR